MTHRSSSPGGKYLRGLLAAAPLAFGVQLATSLLPAHADTSAPAVTAAGTADHATVNAGDPIGFSLTVSNAATGGTAANVTVTDPLPVGTTGPTDVSWVIDTQTAHSCMVTATDGQHPGQELDCLAFTLAPGASYTVHITSTTDGTSCGRYDSTAHVTVPNQGSSPLTAAASTVVQCPDDPITVTADAASATAGSTVGYSVTVSNGGPGTATGVRVDDPLPAAGVTWAISPGYAGPGSCGIAGAAGSQTLSCSLGTMGPGASAAVHVTGTTGTSTCSPLTDTATVASSNAPSASAHATITIICGSVLGARNVIPVPTTGAGGSGLGPAPGLMTGGMGVVVWTALRSVRR